MTKQIFLLSILILIVNYSFSQYTPKKKDIKDNTIQAMTIWKSKYTYQSGQAKETKYKDSYTRYDRQGEIIEEVEYNPDGTIKNKIIYKNDSNGNKIEEIIYNSDGTTIKEKQTFKYNAEGMRIEKKVFSGDGKLLQLIKYEYTYY